jgi:hypothetical protein
MKWRLRWGLRLKLIRGADANIAAIHIDDPGLPVGPDGVPAIEASMVPPPTARGINRLHVRWWVARRFRFQDASAV